MISVIGLGFVGLTTALGFSDKGFSVSGFDINAERESALRKKFVPFLEPVLSEKLSEHFGGNFKLASTIKEALENAEVVFLCVGTPTGKNGEANLDYIKSALQNIVDNAPKDSFFTIVVKSTVPPTTTDIDLRNFLKGHILGLRKNFSLANNPEFLREGFAWHDFSNPDRIVIGVEDKRSEKLLKHIYSPFNVPIHVVSLTTAEFVKYLSNSLLSTLISFSNEMSMLADNIGQIDIKKAFQILHEDRRWYGNPAQMANYVYPGCGFGGYCLPKDTLAFYKKAEEVGINAKILGAVLETNLDIKDFVVNRIIEKAGSLDARIGLLGLAFKPGSDDVRQSPSYEVIRGLNVRGIKNISGFDPVANDCFQKTYPDLNIKFYDSLKDIIQNSDVLALLTAWPEFKNIDKHEKLLDFRYFI